MPVTDLLTKPCTILEVGTPADDYNQTPGGEVSVATLCELQQFQSTEAGEGAVQETVWRLYLPPNIDLEGADAVLVDGARYELAGDPWVVRNPRTGVDRHVEAIVRRVR